jgi:hypothetical protein
MPGLSNGVNPITILRGQGSTKPTYHLPPKQMRALPFLIPAQECVIVWPGCRPTWVSDREPRTLSVGLHFGMNDAIILIGQGPRREGIKSPH